MDALVGKVRQIVRSIRSRKRTQADRVARVQSDSARVNESVRKADAAIDVLRVELDLLRPNRDR